VNIGQAAAQSGLPSKTIRYYEEIGLVTPTRQENGYRDYDNSDVRKLQFVRRARDLGFPVAECRILLSLYEDKNRASADVRQLAQSRVAEIERKLAELASLRDTLVHLVDACHGDERPDCPILEDLSGQPVSSDRASNQSKA